MRYINVAHIKKLAKEKNKRVGKDFLLSLSAHIEDIVIKCCETHNGGKKTIDSTLFGFVTNPAKLLKK